MRRAGGDSLRWRRIWFGVLRGEAGDTMVKAGGRRRRLTCLCRGAGESSARQKHWSPTAHRLQGAAALTVGSVLRGTIINYVIFSGCWIGWPRQCPIKMTWFMIVPRMTDPIVSATAPQESLGPAHTAVSPYTQRVLLTCHSPTEGWVCQQVNNIGHSILKKFTYNIIIVK